jgi:hypothetical protein
MNRSERHSRKKTDDGGQTTENDATHRSGRSSVVRHLSSEWETVPIGRGKHKATGTAGEGRNPRPAGRYRPFVAWRSDLCGTVGVISWTRA